MAQSDRQHVRSQRAVYITLGVSVLVVLTVLTAFAPRWLLSVDGGAKAPGDKLTALDDRRTTVITAVAGLGAAIALALTFLQLSQAKKTSRVENFTNAVALLGGDDAPLGVALGGTYALFTVATQWSEHRRSISDLLTTLVRSSVYWSADQRAAWGQDTFPRLDRTLRIRQPRIQAALDVLVTMPRDESPYRRLNLASCDLQNAYLERANLRYASLRNTNLAYAYLFKADLRHAIVRDAIFTCADLRGVRWAHVGELATVSVKYAWISDNLPDDVEQLLLERGAVVHADTDVRPDDWDPRDGH
jgi:hypothetical protein